MLRKITTRMKQIQEELDVFSLTAMLAKCTRDVLNDTEPPAAKAFRAHIQVDTISATVTGAGYSYVGTCQGLERDDSGHGDQVCDATQTVNNLCRDLLNDEFPRISSGRRLSMDEDVDVAGVRAHDDRCAPPPERPAR